ncbi:MAG: prefoldin subunit alpha [Thermoplasmata archaeon]|nr:prefoldin subunit alpha [Thermoplasmata archaeon]
MPEDNDSINIENQQELQQSMMYLEYIKEQITVLKEQFEILELAVKEHYQAIDTLKDFENLGKNNEILVPIGADSLVFAKVVDHSKVILNIGSGLAMEENLNDGIEKLTSRIENIEDNKNKIETTIQNLQQQATMLTSSIEEKYSTLQK